MAVEPEIPPAVAAYLVDAADTRTETGSGPTPSPPSIDSQVPNSSHCSPKTPINPDQ